ncbi:hypothetical protein K505DRAFT_376973 [Melanomma pulvis-pyrius CBS 109.77]|uniref:Zn(2)-C6 fungal-type domain-containing protein n=1 Tax=Melanomma pulvis-pyrius CBS 109.77 TaxID=1314802 RepID=A0A6A6X4L3_9PLEO|nr:hypothetical protein K505DRAFT_376973 [Melanomma pulvis-pyrius CBS 109.77]
MVGVGGRSKACDNCRRRHVKCDLATPKCRRCIKARLQCDGPRGIAIIPYDGQNKSSQTVNEHRDGVGVSTTGRGLVMPINLRLSVPHEDIFRAFIHSHLLLGNEEIVIAPEVDHPISAQCFLALSATYFGIKHEQKAITQYGLRRYGSALSVVYKALANDDESRSFDVLEAVMIMALIEFLISEREDGWIYHSRGLERLFNIRGLELIASRSCLLILERTRASIIFAAIVLHQPTNLARPEWKTRPWLFHPERIDSLKLLFDILADCPELFVLRDRISTDPDESSKGPAVQLLSTKCRHIIRDLKQWEQDWASSASHASIEIPSPPTTPRSTDSDGKSRFIWPTILQYKSLYHAKAMTVYNGALVLVLRFLHGLRLTEDTHEREALQEQIHAAGLIICRSVDYHHQKTWAEQSSFGLLFPLRMAYDAVGRDHPTIEIWVKGILDDISAGRQGSWKSAKTLLEIRA